MGKQTVTERKLRQKKSPPKTNVEKNRLGSGKTTTLGSLTVDERKVIIHNSLEAITIST